MIYDGVILDKKTDTLVFDHGKLVEVRNKEKHQQGALRSWESYSNEAFCITSQDIGAYWCHRKNNNWTTCTDDEVPAELRALYLLL